MPHRITWRRGKLVLHEHDLAAERVLLALGGDPCSCLLILDAVRDRTEGSGRDSWRSAVYKARAPASPGAWRTASAVGVVSTAIAFTASGPREMLERLQKDPRLSMLPKEQRDRMLADCRRRLVLEMAPSEMLLVLGTAAEIRQGRRRRDTVHRKHDAQDVLQRAAAPAFEEAMRRSRRDLRTYASITVEVWKHGPGEAPLLKGNLTSNGGFAALSLPVSWLNRVWCRGLALVDGHFVVGVDGSAPESEMTGEAVIWERQLGNSSSPVTAPCSLRRLDGQWQLAW